MDSETRYQMIIEQFARVLKMIADQDDEQGGKAAAGIIASSKELLNVGEEGVAFENMVDNLYEINFPLDKQLHRELETLGQLLHFTPDTWKDLASLLVDE